MERHYDDGGYDGYNNYDNSYNNTDTLAVVPITPMVIIFFSWFIINCFCRMVMGKENEVNQPIMKRVKIKKKIKYNDEFRDKYCSICLEEYKEDQILIQFVCNHYFHKECITDWLSTKKSCPLCRMELL